MAFEFLFGSEETRGSQNHASPTPEAFHTDGPLAGAMAEPRTQSLQQRSQLLRPEQSRPTTPAPDIDGRLAEDEQESPDGSSDGRDKDDDRPRNSALSLELTLAEAFDRILDSDAAVDQLIRDDSIDFDDVRRGRLERLWLHFSGDEAREPVHETDAPDDEQPRRKRTRTARGPGIIKPAKAARDPWQPARNIRELSLPNAVTAHLQAYGTTPHPFLTDRQGIYCDLPAPNADQLNEGDQFITLFRYTVELDAHQKATTLRWLFQMLFWFDLVKRIYPRGKGRVGTIIRADVEALLESIDEGDIDRDLVTSNLNQWSINGKKLDFLCREFGTGCLFFLVDVLSSDFLENKMSSSGRYWVGARAHLISLNLEEVASRSQVTELGDNIRKYLIGPFSMLA